jgi:hypothetical protein
LEMSNREINQRDRAPAAREAGIALRFIQTKKLFSLTRYLIRHNAIGLN